jgi:hypothetical protein
MNSTRPPRQAEGPPRVQPNRAAEDFLQRQGGIY